MKKQVWIVFMVFGLAAMACSINLPVNVSGGGAGVTQTMQISESPTAAQVTKLVIEMGAGKLNITGKSENLVDGTIRYNIEQWKPEVIRGDDSITIRQTVNSLDLSLREETVNDWDLKLGSQPLDLSLKAGAYSGQLDFSGVPITHLNIADGASDTDIRFDTPNPVQMDEFVYSTGASDINITGLGNANTDLFRFTGGAGKAELDFSGELAKDMNVQIEGGAGDVQITVPQGTHCILNSTGSLLNINYSGWEKDGDTYTISGEGPVIVFTIDLSVGNLELDVE